MSISKSAKRYQERRQPDHRRTLRGPGHMLNPEDNVARMLPLQPPYPHPDLLRDNNGTPPPDAGHIQTWPYGDSSPA
jgi:hypothetical protein